MKNPPFLQLFYPMNIINSNCCLLPKFQDLSGFYQHGQFKTSHLDLAMNFSSIFLHFLYFSWFLLYLALSRFFFYLHATFSIIIFSCSKLQMVSKIQLENQTHTKVYFPIMLSLFVYAFQVLLLQLNQFLLEFVQSIFFIFSLDLDQGKSLDYLLLLKIEILLLTWRNYALRLEL